MNRPTVGRSLVSSDDGKEGHRQRDSVPVRLNEEGVMEHQSTTVQSSQRELIVAAMRKGVGKDNAAGTKHGLGCSHHAK
jgi:hypothetical protein